MIYLPLEHIPNRYTTHLDRDILEYLNRKGIKYLYLEPKVPEEGKRTSGGNFLNADATVYRQMHQMAQLCEMICKGEIPDNETLFVTDIWNFGVLAVPYINFFCKKNLKVRGILHAGSFTDTDFVRQMERVYKGFEESLFDICDQIFVGSNFIKNDVIQKRYVNPEKLIVTGLPLDYKNLENYVSSSEGKVDRIVFNGRNVDEKQPYLFELLKKKRPQYQYVNTQAENLSKDDYYKVLAESKCVVSFALQENFGYGIQEAVYLGCTPVLPNRLAYVEQFDRKYLYNCFDEAVELVDRAMDGTLDAPFGVSRGNEEIFDAWFKGL